MLPRQVWLDYLIVSFLVASLSAVAVGCGPQIKHGPRITSYSQLHQIGKAIRDYASDHGARPQQLSDLVPQYIPLTQVGIFYVTNKEVRSPFLPPDWASNPSMIDQYSSYVYWGTNSEQGVLAHERLDLWKPGVSYPGTVAVLFDDYHVQFLPTQRVRDMVGSRAPSVK